jgi:hypothetical protein
MYKPTPPAYTRPAPQPETPSLRRRRVSFKEALGVAASVIGITYGGITGIAIVYILWLPRLLMKGPKFPPAKALVFPILIGGYVLLSTVWSEHPEGTARASIEFASMLVCTAIMARIVSVNAFIVGIVGGACAIVMAVMATGGGGAGTRRLSGFEKSGRFDRRGWCLLRVAVVVRLPKHRAAIARLAGSSDGLHGRSVP